MPEKLCDANNRVQTRNNSKLNSPSFRLTDEDLSQKSNEKTATLTQQQPSLIIRGNILTRRSTLFRPLEKDMTENI